MYSDFYGFAEDPFRLAPDRRFAYLGEAHQETCAALIDAALSGQPVVLVSGEPGTGKSLALELVAGELERHGYRVRACWGGHASAPARELTRQAGGAPGKRAGVLLVDEAQTLDRAALSELLQAAQREAAQLILAGAPGVAARLAALLPTQVPAATLAHYRLRPLDTAEVEAYVNARVAAAGVDRSMFSAVALERLAASTGGVPARINLLCANALLSAFARDSRIVEVGDVEAAAAMRDMEAHAAAQAEIPETPEDAQPEATPATEATSQSEPPALAQVYPALAPETHDGASHAPSGLLAERQHGVRHRRKSAWSSFARLAPVLAIGAAVAVAVPWVSDDLGAWQSAPAQPSARDAASASQDAPTALLQPESANDTDTLADAGPRRVAPSPELPIPTATAVESPAHALESVPIQQALQPSARAVTALKPHTVARASEAPPEQSVAKGSSSERFAGKPEPASKERRAPDDAPQADPAPSGAATRATGATTPAPAETRDAPAASARAARKTPERSAAARPDKAQTSPSPATGAPRPAVSIRYSKMEPANEGIAMGLARHLRQLGFDVVDVRAVDFMIDSGSVRYRLERNKKPSKRLMAATRRFLPGSRRSADWELRDFNDEASKSRRGDIEVWIPNRRRFSANDRGWPSAPKPPRS